jgi:arylsulfatase A-like enzyme
VLREHLADYYGMISHMDAEIGRVLAELNRLELAENTIVVFAADNGLALGQHGLLGKQNLYEHSVKVPLVVALPKEPQPGRQVSSLNYLFDIGPTLCELAGVNTPPGMTGRSLVPQLRGNSTAEPRESVLTAYRDGQRAVVTERWKLMRYPRVDRTQLFDLESDPWEMRDLAAKAEQATRVTELRGTLESLQMEWGDKLTWTSPERDVEQVELPPKR